MPPIYVLIAGQRMFHINSLDLFVFSMMFDKIDESMIW